MSKFWLSLENLKIWYYFIENIKFLHNILKLSKVWIPNRYFTTLGSRYAHEIQKTALFVMGIVAVHWWLVITEDGLLSELLHSLRMMKMMNVATVILAFLQELPAILISLILTCKKNNKVK